MSSNGEVAIMPGPSSSRPRPSEDTDLAVLDTGTKHQRVPASAPEPEPNSNIINSSTSSPTIIGVSDSEGLSDFDSDDEFGGCGCEYCAFQRERHGPAAAQSQVQQIRSADTVVNSREHEERDPSNGIQEGCAAIVRLAPSEGDSSVWDTKQIDVRQRYMEDPEDGMEVIDWSWPAGLTLIKIVGTYIPQDHEIDFDLSVMGIRLGHIEDVVDDYVEVSVSLTAAYGNLLFYEIDTELWVEINMHTALGGSYKGSIQVWTSRTEEEHLHGDHGAEVEIYGDGSKRSESDRVEREGSGGQ